ncbi:hypothetical protein H8689_07465 [Lachnospiraceae bacterium NSJ-29]|uniref:Uncharacterized protein n=1 Tax=Wansuia hejianensis TaxID=2763667 RepID=A0A926F2Z0_9FIRM|nr:hypothetical protein [Wansuia hejianensis]
MGEPQPSVKMGKPEDIQEYDEYDINGIKVFVKSDVQAKNNELKVRHSKVLWSEKLIVEGMAF